MKLLELLFGKKKKKKQKATASRPRQAPRPADGIPRNSNGERLDRLTEDGKLPSGWESYHKEFVNKKTVEFDGWIAFYTKPAPVRQKRENLVYFIDYLMKEKEECEKLGECYAKWFEWCICDDKYMKMRMDDLEYYDKNMEKLEKREAIRAAYLGGLEENLLNIVSQKPGILQTDIYKMFPAELKDDISSKLYFLYNKDGKITREKEGRTYKLYINS